MGRPLKPQGTTADRIVAFRLTPADEALLDAIVVANEQRLVEQGIIASVRTADIVRTLIRREAAALGIEPQAGRPASARGAAKLSRTTTARATSTPPERPATAGTRKLLRGGAHR